MFLFGPPSKFRNLRSILLCNSAGCNLIASRASCDVDTSSSCEPLWLCGPRFFLDFRFFPAFRLGRSPSCDPPSTWRLSGSASSEALGCVCWSADGTSGGCRRSVPFGGRCSATAASAVSSIGSVLPSIGSASAVAMAASTGSSGNATHASSSSESSSGCPDRASWAAWTALSVNPSAKRRRSESVKSANICCMRWGPPAI
mmetsp:Transcript_78337/g.227287  ORF Transcript_78337/g.227287 Transcript_78337/m.227287 type:complete len:201 (+) Transcript_78337:1135-1737(+)